MTKQHRIDSAVIGCLVIGSWLLFTSAVVVDVTQFAVITTFGHPSQSITNPGLYFKWPFPVQSCTTIEARLLVLDPPDSEYLTRDKKNIVVNSFICWKVKNPLRYLESVGSRKAAELRLSDILCSELGAMIGKNDFAAWVSSDPSTIAIDAMMTQLTSECREVAQREFGIEVVDVHCKRLNFPEQNRASVFNRMRAERERIATRYRSEGEEEATKIKAKADRERRELLADAHGQAEKIRGEGNAEATSIYGQSYGANPQFYQFMETLNTYKDILNQQTTVVIPGDSKLGSLLYKGTLSEK